MAAFADTSMVTMREGSQQLELAWGGGGGGSAYIGRLESSEREEEGEYPGSQLRGAVLLSPTEGAAVDLLRGEDNFLWVLACAELNVSPHISSPTARGNTQDGNTC